jgi:hypothetical protein
MQPIAILFFKVIWGNMQYTVAVSGWHSVTAPIAG